MQKFMIRFLALSLCFVFVHSADSQEKKPGIRKVCLFNSATNEMRRDCIEIMGKGYYKPEYECPDEKTGKTAAVDLGTDWKPIAISRPVCMKNRATGVVKPDCVKYESGKERARYLDVKKTGEYVVLDEKWEPLSLDAPLCKSVEILTDVGIKDFEFEIISGLENPVKKDGGK